MKIIRHIATIKEWKTVSLELNVIEWNLGKQKYDLRKWRDGEPTKNGVTFEREEIEDLFLALAKELGKNIESNEDCKTLSFNNIDDYPFDVLDSNVPNNDNDIFPLEMDESSNSIEKSMREDVLDYRNVVVHDKYDDCVANMHDYKDIIAIIPIYTKTGVEERRVSARHCRTCGAYYISTSSYSSLIKRGRILCKVVTKKEYEQFIKNKVFGELKPQSILTILGYSVNSKDDLSDTCRQTILTRAIDAGAVTKRKAINIISFLIKLNENKDNMSIALEKWNRDRMFLQGGKMEGTIQVTGIINN